MSVYRVTEVIGTSTQSWEDAATTAVKTAGKTLRELHLRRELGLIVLAIRRDDGRMDFNPDAETLLHGGDHLIVMADSEAVRKLEELVAEVSR